MKLYKIMAMFSLANWAILLFYLYGYTFDHTTPAHPDGLVGVFMVAATTGLVAFIDWDTRR